MHKSTSIVNTAQQHTVPTRQKYLLPGCTRRWKTLVWTKTLAKDQPLLVGSQMTERMELGPPNTLTHNIILNHDFSEGLLSWHPNSCEAYVVPPGTPNSIASKSGQYYAVVTKRTESWQGLEQDVTGQVSPGSTYTVSAIVRVRGALEGSTDIQAMVLLQHRKNNQIDPGIALGRSRSDPDRISRSSRPTESLI
ncbi:hypothetical protein Taro_047927 [Colocasia esculenta]|uniref:CBM-cenC domain-containing protein n=1 Tax=Colocasia esculenta TaxID=4460 RepID=A0A843WX77_COLES|nr:hypothetical protein [Colocasia esculenta]